MKTYIMKPGILLLTIFSLQFILKSQNFEQTIDFADAQFKLKNHQLAVKEYQRALLFSDGKKQDYLYTQIANSFFETNKTEQARYFYDLAYRTSTNDSIKTELLFNKSMCYMLSSDFRHAIYELSGLKPDSEYFRDKMHFYLAVSHFGLEEFEKSEQFFLLLTDNDSLEYKEIDKLFDLRRNLHRPNPKTAKTLSIIIPGSGQLYAGDIKNSINSLALTGGLAILGFHIFEQYSLLDAMLSVFPWFTRYYKGGYIRASEIAEKKRASRRNKTFQEILKIISKNQYIEGQKPE